MASAAAKALTLRRLQAAQFSGTVCGRHCGAVSIRPLHWSCASGPPLATRRSLASFSRQSSAGGDATASSSSSTSPLRKFIYCAAGLAVATPVISLGQAGYSLLEYRRKHANAPRARCPSRGIVACAARESGAGVGGAEEEDSKERQVFEEAQIKSSLEGSEATVGEGSTSVGGRWGILGRLPWKRKIPKAPAPISKGESEAHSLTSTEDDLKFDPRPPLRVLVLGDSLAFGIGQCRNATPVMPESLARSLSRQMDGRTVCWTCQGKPGLTAAQLVKEIEVWTEMERAADADTTAAAAKNPSFARLRSRLLASHGPGFDPSNCGPFDLVVIAIGMGDLKGTALPFLRVSDHENHGDQPTAGTFRGDLERILEQLGEKGLIRRCGEGAKDSPMVMFPALPARPPPIFRRPPLKWFVLPLVKYIDSDKEELAAKLSPNGVGSAMGSGISVAFAPEPTDRMFLDWEDGIGKLWREAKGEAVAVSVGDMEPAERKQLEGDMRAHWGRQPNDEDDVFSFASAGSLEGSSSVSSGVLKALKEYIRHPGAMVVSTDDLHPNDEGYDFWGRCIAQEVERTGWLGR
uniref:SGNH hydrolase-type esterase domain-containing protein n=1 Tax=Odontella aurita TaxID=265563 RepID=A0A7S4MVR8_9STRA|mmetsp:Transcript_35430/g.105804  ORF Transcript_35430/g.105804 Transcript_35430/m.105804 type:complete len:577 (+) Transcript_35430:164-1894(+)